MSGGNRQDQFLVTVTAQQTVGGPLTSLGRFDKRSGGTVSASDTKHRPGGSADELSFGGPRTTENVTVQRNYDADRDDAIVKRLRGLVGQATVVVSQQPLDGTLTAKGEPTVWRGTLIKVTAPDADSTASGTSMFELEVSVSGSVA